MTAPPSTPQEAVSDYLAALGEEDWDTAWELTCEYLGNSDYYGSQELVVLMEARGGRMNGTLVRDPDVAVGDIALQEYGPRSGYEVDVVLSRFGATVETGSIFVMEVDGKLQVCSHQS